MQQGLLFEPQVMARTELQDAIARLDFHSAMRRLEEFQRVWPEAKLTWEPELVCAGSRMAAKLLDLDSGYGAWQKLEARLNTLDVSRSWTASLRRNFFSRLLASNRKLFEELRTAADRSLGDFYLLAEQPRNARRRYENEIGQIGDGWKVRLQLGNCDFRLGDGAMAHANYHWSCTISPKFRDFRQYASRCTVRHRQPHSQPGAHETQRLLQDAGLRSRTREETHSDRNG